MEQRGALFVACTGSSQVNGELCLFTYIYIFGCWLLWLMFTLVVVGLVVVGFHKINVLCFWFRFVV